MTTVNPFDLLGDDDNDDPSQLIAAAQQQKIAAAAAMSATGGKKSSTAAVPAAAKMPVKPVPPSQAVREARNASNAPSPRGSGGKGGPGQESEGKGAGIGANIDSGDVDANGFTGGYGGYGGSRSGFVVERDAGRSSERGRGGYGPPRQSFRGGRRGGYGNGDGEGGAESERASRRVYERRSGTGRVFETKREGAGRGNWGRVTDDVNAQETEESVNPDEKVASPENIQGEEDDKPVEGDKDAKENGASEEEAKPEDKEMTLDEYEKILEEKRKTLLAMKAEERKVSIDKELESMQQLTLKKGNDDVFIKLGSVKESKKKNIEREERAKKSVSIHAFLKPAEGERYYSPGGRGRGRGRGDRESIRGGYGGGGYYNTPAAPAIEDPGQFPTLGGGGK